MNVLLNVSNEGVESGSCAVLLLLDLTATFDTVEHNFLINCLRDQVGIQGLALDWFSLDFLS